METTKRSMKSMIVRPIAITQTIKVVIVAVTTNKTYNHAIITEMHVTMIIIIPIAITVTTITTEMIMYGYNNGSNNNHREKGRLAPTSFTPVIPGMVEETSRWLLREVETIGDQPLSAADFIKNKAYTFELHLRWLIHVGPANELPHR